MKIRNIILMAGMMLLAACSDDDDKQAVEQVTGPTEVCVISCNVLADNSNQTGDLSWKKRRDALVNMVETEKPDVLCLQGQYWNQVIYLEQQLAGYASVDYNVNGNDANTGRHNTVMYRADKYTLLQQGRYWLSQKPNTMTYPWASKDEERRCTTWALLKDNSTNARFYVACTQMNDGDEPEDMAARLNSAELNVEMIQQMVIDNGGTTPVILAGDMNASNDADDARRDCLAPYYGWMTDARTVGGDTKPSYNGLGTPAAGARLTPDHIFLYKAVPQSFTTLDGNYGVAYISDHNPISCKVKF
ncbi:endonuclease/exonuclease/phosphatase family protein [Muribaculum intestinale]|uniref:endonuclease/exonuclease/phosphatase family protein n=1 Tax=Muribaculum intestinale TaxID=1796646 RepID=UPI00242FCAEB|nr:endonuclease/exonuclease/phosphatase family protein [Muribaculum intestinale]